jgi:DNA-binding transcriptional ArsR family regulator
MICYGGITDDGSRRFPSIRDGWGRLGAADGAGRGGDLAELFRVLGDPVRARVISALSGGRELCVGDVALAIDASENTVSYALGVLRRARLVERQRRGRAIYYRIADPRLPELVELARGTPT